MPALVGTYQYTWSMAQSSSLTSSRQVNFPPSFTSQPQHPYLTPNSVPQLPPQHFPHAHHPPVPVSQLSSTTQHQSPVTLTQPLYQHQIMNCSIPTRTTEHQKGPGVETSPNPVPCTSASSQPFSTCDLSSNVQQHPLHTTENNSQDIYREATLPVSTQ